MLLRVCIFLGKIQVLKRQDEIDLLWNGKSFADQIVACTSDFQPVYQSEVHKNNDHQEIYFLQRPCSIRFHCQPFA